MFASGPSHHFVNKFHNNRLVSGGWDGQLFFDLWFHLRSLVLRFINCHNFVSTLFEVQFKVNSTTELNQPQ